MSYELEAHIRDYLSVLSKEDPHALMEVRHICSDLRRMLGDGE